jgi:hypothetical protein
VTGARRLRPFQLMALVLALPLFGFDIPRIDQAGRNEQDPPDECESCRGDVFLNASHEYVCRVCGSVVPSTPATQPDTS